MQENSTIFHTDLEVLHNRLDTLKSTIAENDRLLGHFAAERICAVKQGKEIIEHYVLTSDKKAECTKKKLENMMQLARNFLYNLQENIDSIDSAVDDQVKLKKIKM